MLFKSSVGLSLHHAPDSDAEFVDFRAKCGAGNAEAFGSFGLVTIAFLKDFRNQLPFDFFNDIVVSVGECISR